MRGRQEEKGKVTGAKEAWRIRLTGPGRFWEAIEIGSDVAHRLQITIDGASDVNGGAKTLESGRCS